MTEKTTAIFDIPMTQVITSRKSVRSYRTEPLPSDTLKKIEDYVSAIKGPFPVSVRFQMVSAAQGTEGSVNPGTGGVIRGASSYLTAAVGREGRNLEQLGYTMEKAILYMTSLGLGTCWLGGTFNRSEFEKAVKLGGDETLPCVVSVGFPAEKQGFMNSFIRFSARSANRKGWEEMFFRERFGSPLAQDDAGAYAQSLEMVRLAPSASNRQPWRVVAVSDRYHFFLQRTPGYPKMIKYDIQRIDPGIAMCHFEMTAVEAGLSGHWSMKQPVLENKPEGIEYIASWVNER